MRSFASYFLINITLLKGPTRLQDLGQTTVVLLGNEMERKGRQHCVKSAGIGFDPSTLGSILGKNRSIWFSNRRIIYTLYKGPTLSTTVRHPCGIPWQQFCVRKVMSPAMRSKSA